MQTGYKDIFQNTREKGFTLIESLLVIGLTSLIAAGVVAALLEGMGAIRQMADSQTVEYGHQRAMQVFMNDVQAAQWFYNDTVHEAGGGTVLRDVPNPLSLIMGYTGPDGEEVWIRYRTRPGIFGNETYLVRTIASTKPVIPAEEGWTLLATGVANLAFNYYDADGNITSELSDVKRISMVLSLDVNGATVQREYDSVLRNANEGVRACPFNFDEIEADHPKK